MKGEEYQAVKNLVGNSDRVLSVQVRSGENAVKTKDLHQTSLNRSIGIELIRSINKFILIYDIQQYYQVLS